MKRFAAGVSDKMQAFVDDENPRSCMVALSGDYYPQLEVTYGGPYKNRPADMIDVAQFIGVKSHRAKGKRVTTYDVASLRFAESLRPAPLDMEPETGGEDADMAEEGDNDAPAYRATGDGATVTVADSDVVVERETEDDEQDGDTQQLNLFGA